MSSQHFYLMLRKIILLILVKSIPPLVAQIGKSGFASETNSFRLFRYQAARMAKTNY